MKPTILPRQMSARRLAALLLASALPALASACATEITGEDEPGLDDIEASKNRTPVVFVHGCQTPDATDADAAAYFDPMKAYFAQRSYPSDRLVSFLNGEEQCTSNARFAAQLAQTVDDVRRTTGSSKVDIVAFSMGALAGRLYLTQGGTSYVQSFVSISGANHGSSNDLFDFGVSFQDLFGGYPWFEGMQEMTPAYACQGQTYGGSADVQFALNGCLTATGRTVARDETPGSVRYLSIRNAQDEIVTPVASACLNQRKQNDCGDTAVNKLVSVPPGIGPRDCASGCPAHLTVLFNTGVMEQTYNFLVAEDQ